MIVRGRCTQQHTWSVLIAKPAEFTGTYAPASSCVRRGVRRTAANVEQTVIMTDRGTSPLAMNVTCAMHHAYVAAAQ